MFDRSFFTYLDDSEVVNVFFPPSFIYISSADNQPLLFLLFLCLISKNKISEASFSASHSFQAIRFILALRAAKQARKRESHLARIHQLLEELERDSPDLFCWFYCLMHESDTFNFFKLPESNILGTDKFQHMKALRGIFMAFFLYSGVIEVDRRRTQSRYFSHLFLGLRNYHPLAFECLDLFLARDGSLDVLFFSRTSPLSNKLQQDLKEATNLSGKRRALLLEAAHFGSVDALVRFLALDIDLDDSSLLHARVSEARRQAYLGASTGSKERRKILLLEALSRGSAMAIAELIALDFSSLEKKEIDLKALRLSSEEAEVWEAADSGEKMALALAGFAFLRGQAQVLLELVPRVQKKELDLRASKIFSIRFRLPSGEEGGAADQAFLLLCECLERKVEVDFGIFLQTFLEKKSKSFPYTLLRVLGFSEAEAGLFQRETDRVRQAALLCETRGKKHPEEGRLLLAWLEREKAGKPAEAGAMILGGTQVFPLPRLSNYPHIEYKAVLEVWQRKIKEIQIPDSAEQARGELSALLASLDQTIHLFLQAGIAFFEGPNFLECLKKHLESMLQTLKLCVGLANQHALLKTSLEALEKDVGEKLTALTSMRSQRLPLGTVSPQEEESVKAAVADSGRQSAESSAAFSSDLSASSSSSSVLTLSSSASSTRKRSSSPLFFSSSDATRTKVTAPTGLSPSSVLPPASALVLTKLSRWKVRFENLESTFGSDFQKKVEFQDFVGYIDAFLRKNPGELLSTCVSLLPIFSRNIQLMIDSLRAEAVSCQLTEGIRLSEATSQLEEVKREMEEILHEAEKGRAQQPVVP